MGIVGALRPHARCRRRRGDGPGLNRDMLAPRDNFPTGRPMSHELIVLPDDTAKPLIDALNGAKLSVNIRMFLFTDPSMVEAVVAAERRGVKVRVMLNPARRDGSAEAPC